MARVLRGPVLAVLAGCGPLGDFDRALTGEPAGASPSGGGSTVADAGDGEVLTDDAEVEPPGPACDEETPVVLYVSPDDSNSMSSPVQAREAVLGGWGGLGAVPIRTWEFFNYASWDYPPADPGALAVDLQLAEGAEPGEFVLQVGIASERVPAAERAPMNLTFSVDQSGSMSGEPLALMKETLRVINGQLRAGDVVSMVEWSSGNAVILDGHAVEGPNDPRFAEAIEQLSAGGGTNLGAGLREAYRLANEHFVPGRINRVVLLSDGGANLGQTDEEVIGGHAGAHDEDGIYMVGVGTGTAATYNDLLMDRVTDVGRGASVFVPSRDEAHRMFGDRFLETLATSARDVRIRYDLPPGFEVVQFSGEEIATDPEEVQPQHVAPNDAVVLHQHLRTCAEPLDDAVIGVTVSYYDGVTFEPREVTVSRTLGELLAGDRAALLKGAAVFAYAEALKRSRGEEALYGVEEALAALATAEEANPGDADLAEIRTVLERL